MTKPTVVTIVGTRPEIIRLSRLIPLLDEHAHHVLIHTGQNYDPQLSDVFFSELKVREPDHYLGVDTTSLGTILGDTLRLIEPVLRDIKPDAVLVLGDTNSAIATLMAKRMHIPVYHMEAGNRSFDQNVPEETNRLFVDHIADFNLAYTEHARRNLLAEGLPPQRIAVTGSPMREVLDYFRGDIEASTVLADLDVTHGEYFLASAHRQENVDSPARLRQLIEALAAVSERWNHPVLVSTHPRTRARLDALDMPLPPSLRFHPPFGFLDYCALQLAATCVLSDSGTISEEAAILGFPAVTIRNSMERPEALETGVIVMTGLDASEVVSGVELAIAGVGREHAVPSDYLVRDTSQRVMRFLFSTMHRHAEWAGIRPTAN